MWYAFLGFLIGGAEESISVWFGIGLCVFFFIDIFCESVIAVPVDFGN